MTEYRLQTAEGDEIPVDVTVLRRCGVFKGMFNDIGDADPCFPAPNTPTKVVTFLRDFPWEGEEAAQAAKIQTVERDDLFDLLQACNFLEIDDLLPRCKKRLEAMIKQPDSEALRQVFGITEGFTAAEKKTVQDDIAAFFAREKRRHQQEREELQGKMEEDFNF